MKISKNRSFYKTPKVIIIVLSILSIILIAALIVSILIIIKLNRNNMFSKSILLDNNYFLDNALSQSDSLTSTDKNIYFEHENISSTAKDNRLKILFSEIQSASDVDTTTLDVIMQMADSIYLSNGINYETDKEVEQYINDNYGISIKICDYSKKIINVPYISQKGKYPNGCESVSATMLLQYYKFDITVDDFIDKYLDCGKTYISWGCRYGPNPKQKYAGNPRSEKNGWGSFAPVIVRAMNKYLPSGYSARNITGTTLNNIKGFYLDNDIPVIIWATIKMEAVDKILQWQSSENHNETFLYPSNEHCLVLIGYDDENFIFADPYDSLGIVSYPINDTVLAYNTLGMQAVVIDQSN